MGTKDCSADEAEPFILLDPMQKTMMKKRKKRFSDDQIRSLESLFEKQEKLDPARKLQLAGDLGLQPRQLSIWFQNRRARWKSKQLEREYGDLRAEYDALLSAFESMKKEKQILTKKKEMLGELLEGRSRDGDPGNGDNDDHRPSPPVAAGMSDSVVTTQSSDRGVEMLTSSFSKEEPELYTGDFSTSAEQQFFVQPSWPSDQFSDCSQWWEFLPAE